MEENKKLQEIRGDTSEKSMADVAVERLYYPRVSEIIGKQTQEEYANIAPYILEKAAFRGTIVHEYCQSYAQGHWSPAIEEKYEGYIKAFTKWYDASVEKLLATGERLYDDRLRFTGEFDMIVVLKSNKQVALIDLKTSSGRSKSWPIQLAAYKHLCELNGYTIHEVYNLHITKKKGGLFEAQEIAYQNLEKEWRIFSCALECFDYFHRKEKSHGTN